MTNEEILKLAETCGFTSYVNDLGCDSEKHYLTTYDCYEEQLLKFALAIHENGYNKGYDEGNEQHRSKEND